MAGTNARPPFAQWLATTNDITSVFLAAGDTPDLVNLAGGLPEPATFPVEAIAAIARGAFETEARAMLAYGPVEGLPQLRDALAARFSSTRLRLRRENVLVTSGGMQGLDLIGKVLLDDGGLIAAQFPTYLGALDAWRPRRPTIRPLELDNPDFDADAALTGAQFAYTVPNYSNPTGKMVDLAVRRTLVDAAERTGVWLVEDDPYGGLIYEGEPQPRMLELSARVPSNEAYDGPVIYMGTLSKEIAPGLRVGWVIAAPALIKALALAKQGSDMCTSGVTQRIALGAMAAGLIEQIQPTVLATYRTRRDALCAAMDAQLGDWLEWKKPAGGMFVWAVAKDPDFDTDAYLAHAMAAGVCIAPSSVFDASGRNRRALRINFTLNAPDRLIEGVKRLARAKAAMAVAEAKT